MGANYSRNERWSCCDKTRDPTFRERLPVTVGIAASFVWNYAEFGKAPDLGTAAIIATDRMLTTGDVQYEPTKIKVAQPTPSTLILVAGDFAYHSQAIKRLFKKVDSTAAPENIATIYSQIIQGIKRKEAEDLFLAPLGLNTDTFLAQQKEMSD